MSAPNDVIPRGTLCFLTGGRDGLYGHLVGRVVEVVGGPRKEWEHVKGPRIYYDIRAGWITELFPERDIIVKRKYLIPIAQGSRSAHTVGEFAAALRDLEAAQGVDA